jgi:hypothetical protein
VAILGGLILGTAVNLVLSAITGNEQVSASVGTGIWLMSTVLILMYGSLWTTDPEEIRNPPPPGSTGQCWRMEKADRKLATAELRVGVVFAFIGGGMASAANGSPSVVAAVAVGCALVGGLLGHDYRRRVRRIKAGGESPLQA